MTRTALGLCAVTETWIGDKSTEEGLLPQDRLQVSFSITAARATVFDGTHTQIHTNTHALAYFNRKLLTRECALTDSRTLFNSPLTTAEHEMALFRTHLLVLEVCFLNQRGTFF